MRIRSAGESSTLWFVLHSIARRTSGTLSGAHLPDAQFVHAGVGRGQRLPHVASARADTRPVVTPSATTLSASCFADLSRAAQIELPGLTDRHYSLQVGSLRRVFSGSRGVVHGNRRSPVHPSGTRVERTYPPLRTSATSPEPSNAAGRASTWRPRSPLAPIWPSLEISRVTATRLIDSRNGGRGLRTDVLAERTRMTSTPRCRGRAARFVTPPPLITGRSGPCRMTHVHQARGFEAERAARSRRCWAWSMGGRSSSSRWMA